MRLSLLEVDSHQHLPAGEPRPQSAQAFERYHQLLYSIADDVAWVVDAIERLDAYEREFVVEEGVGRYGTPYGVAEDFEEEFERTFGGSGERSYKTVCRALVSGCVSGISTALRELWRALTAVVVASERLRKAIDEARRNQEELPKAEISGFVVTASELASLRESEEAMLQLEDFGGSVCELRIELVESLVKRSLGGFGELRSGRYQQILSLHGIRTQGGWQAGFDRAVDKVAPDVVKHLALCYHPCWAVQFVQPRIRQEKVEWFREEYEKATEEYRVRRPSVVAHSFGTFITMYALRKYKKIVLDRLILCGCILPERWDWYEFIPTQVRVVLHQYGHRDRWPVVASCVVRGTGRSGRCGFSNVAGLGDRFVEQEMPEMGHSCYFHDLNYREVWMPFLLGRRV